jgi:hypothetical protein
MTQDEIIEIAQECKLIGMRPFIDGIYTEALIEFAKLVAAKEREALAQTQEPQIAFNAEVIGYVAPQRTWVGLTEDEVIYLLPAGEWEIESTLELAKILENNLKEKNT